MTSQRSFSTSTGGISEMPKASLRTKAMRYESVAQKALGVVKDEDIRRALFPMLRSKAGRSALVVEELGLCEGEVFADLAVIQNSLEGFEIKSDADSLKRFLRQRDVYSRVMARASIVVTTKHLSETRGLLPKWWGILLALPEDCSVKITTVREARDNPAIDPKALVQLLWRDEALHHLDKLGQSRGFKSKPRRDIWARLATELSAQKLQAIVCQSIKTRAGWRVA